MDYDENVIEIRKPIEFTIDGHTYQTLARWQPAGDLLLLAGLDPNAYHLSEVRRHHPVPVHYGKDEIVAIHRRARFVAIRDRADAI